MASPTYPGPRLFGRQGGGQVMEDDTTFLQAYLQSSRNAANEQASQRSEDAYTLRDFLMGQRQQALQKAQGQQQLALEQARAKDTASNNWVALPEGAYDKESPIGRAVGVHPQYPDLGPGMRTQQFNALQPAHAKYETQQAIKSEAAGWLQAMPGFKTSSGLPDTGEGPAAPMTPEDRAWNLVRERVRQSSETGQPLPPAVEQALGRHISKLLGDEKGQWVESRSLPGTLYHSQSGETKPLEGFSGKTTTLTDMAKKLLGLPPGVTGTLTQQPGKAEPTLSMTSKEPASFEQRAARWADMPEGPEKVAEGKKLDAIAGVQAKAGGLLATARGQGGLDLPWDASPYGKGKVVLDPETFTPMASPGTARDVLDAKSGGHVAVVTTQNADKINFYRGITPNLDFLEKWAPQILSEVGPGQPIENAVQLFANRRFGTGTPAAQQFLGAWDEVRRAAVTGLTRAETGGTRPAVLVYQMINDVTGKDTDTARRALGQFGAAKQTVRNQMRALAGLPTQDVTMPGTSQAGGVPSFSEFKSRVGK